MAGIPAIRVAGSKGANAALDGEDESSLDSTQAPLLTKALSLTASTSGSELSPSQRVLDLGPPQPSYYGVHYQRYSLATYLQLPLLLRPFVRLPGLRNFLVVARPTMDASGGLAGYRQAVPKAVRRRAPFLVVVDRPGQATPDSKYHWVEFPLPDVFKLDVSGLASFEEYARRCLRSRHRRALRVRQQELVGSPIVFEHLPLEHGNRPLVDALWALYRQNGRRHGFRVLSRRDFYCIHSGATPGLSVLLARDSSRGGDIVTFVTVVRTADTLLSMWCGTDYSNPLSRSCSTYINAQYELVRAAIQEPGIRWLDLGAQLRQVKCGLGCEGHPVSGYLRCKSKAMRAVSERMMQAYFNPSKLLTDP